MKDEDDTKTSTVWKAVAMTALALFLIAACSPFVLVWVQLWKSCSDCN